MKEVKPKVQGPKLTPKSLWRNKRSVTDFITWSKQLDAYIEKVNPKPKNTGRRG